MPRTPRHQIVDLTDEVSVSPYATLDSADHQLIDELHETLGLEIMEANIERIVYAVLEADARHSHQIEVGRRDFLPRFDMVRAVYNRTLAIAEQEEDLVGAQRHRSESPGFATHPPRDGYTQVSYWDRVRMPTYASMALIPTRLGLSRIVIGLQLLA